MANTPKAVSELAGFMHKLPGIGSKTAQKLAYYMLYMPQAELEAFAQSISTLKKKTTLCTVCHNVAEASPCGICSDPTRDTGKILVVEQAIEIATFEKAGVYNGLYHVLHGVINPLENIGPDDLFLEDLVKRAGSLPEDGEVIIATNPTLEGEATAMYLKKRISQEFGSVSLTRLAMGIPSGAHLEYADDMTLNHAILGRRKV